MKLLLIEDNAALQTTLQRSFERRGMHVVVCGDGALAVEQWRRQRPDVVLLDLSLPGVDGLDVLAQARAGGLATPVLILTARSTVGDRVLGLNIGGDDYLAKPFDLDELEARVRALARRARGGASPGSRSALDSGPQEVVAEFAGMRVDSHSGAVLHHGLPIELAPRELALLRALLARPGHAVAKERLFELVYPGEADVNYEAIEVVVYRLRKRIAHTGARVVTLRGLGYLLKAPQ